MASKTKKKYTYSTKAVLMPDGTRKYIRAKTREELDEKVLQAQILVKSGVDICSEETFGHFAQMWFDIYKKPYLREKTKMQLNMCLITRIAPAWRLSSPRYRPHANPGAYGWPFWQKQFPTVKGSDPPAQYLHCGH